MMIKASKKTKCLWHSEPSCRRMHSSQPTCSALCSHSLPCTPSRRQSHVFLGFSELHQPALHHRGRSVPCPIRVSWSLQMLGRPRYATATTPFNAALNIFFGLVARATHPLGRTHHHRSWCSRSRSQVCHPQSATHAWMPGPRPPNSVCEAQQA